MMEKLNREEHDFVRMISEMSEDQLTDLSEAIVEKFRFKELHEVTLISAFRQLSPMQKDQLIREAIWLAEGNQRIREMKNG